MMMGCLFQEYHGENGMNSIGDDLYSAILTHAGLPDHEWQLSRLSTRHAINGRSVVPCTRMENTTMP